MTGLESSLIRLELPLTSSTENNCMRRYILDNAVINRPMTVIKRPVDISPYLCHDTNAQIPSDLFPVFMSILRAWGNLRGVPYLPVSGINASASYLSTLTLSLSSSSSNIFPSSSQPELQCSNSAADKHPIQSTLCHLACRLPQAKLLSHISSPAGVSATPELASDDTPHWRSQPYDCSGMPAACIRLPQFKIAKL